MKKLVKPTLLAALMTLTVASTSSAFSETPRKAENIKALSEGEVKQMISRLEEIKAMDISSMSRSEKRHLKHEVKAIHHKLQTQGGGVYISVGGLIIILLLLIIIL